MPNRPHPSYGPVLAGLAVVSAGAILFAPAPPPARVVGGLLLTLVLPGAALTRAMFPQRHLSGVERLVLALALSLATVALGGLGLYAAGIRLAQPSWVALTAGVTVLAAVVGQFRLRQRPARTAAPPESADRVEKRDQIEEPDRAEGPDHTDEPDHAEASDHAEEPDRAEASDHAEEPDRAEGADHADEPDHAEDLDRVDRDERADRAEEPERLSRAVDSDEPDSAGPRKPDPAGVGTGTLSADVAGHRRRANFRPAVLRLAPLLLTVALLIAAGWYSLRGAAQEPTEPFSALQMVPAFATEAPGPTRTVSVGLDCHERAATDYLLRVRGSAGFTRTLQVRLRPGEDWARQVTVPSTGRVTVDLYRDGETSAYRTVFLDTPSERW